MLEAEVVKIFIESLPEEERGFAEIARWSDFSAWSDAIYLPALLVVLPRPCPLICKIVNC
jgi:hypothetical protein